MHVGVLSPETILIVQLQTALHALYIYMQYCIYYLNNFQYAIVNSNNNNATYYLKFVFSSFSTANTLLLIHCNNQLCKMNLYFENLDCGNCCYYLNYFKYDV